MILAESPSATRPPTIDLTSCDREQIHAPGCIQPHGILLAFSPHDFRIIAVSQNAGHHIGRPVGELLGTPLARLLDSSSYEAVCAAARQPVGESAWVAHVGLAGRDHRGWRTSLHVTPTGILLEAELAPADRQTTALDQFVSFQQATRHLQAAADLAATCERLAHEVRRLTGFDRVGIYRFTTEWNGEVIAESSSGALSPFLGLHFPATDIPAPARLLYARQVERQIPDVRYTPVPILQSGPDPLDLSQAALRSVSPIHLMYLQNMAVGASMSVSIMRRGRLWGLIVCHHRSPFYVSPEIRQANVLLAQLASSQLSLFEESEIARRGIAVKAVEATLLREAADGRDMRDALLESGPLLLDLLGATGLALSSGGPVTKVGETPEIDALHAIFDWLNQRRDDYLATDYLPGLFADAAGLPEAAGMLAVPLGGFPPSLLVWFRPAITRAVAWAGEPVKHAEGTGTAARLTPRHSFTAWTQHVTGRARPWTAAEISAAKSLRDTLIEIILRRALELDRMNAQLLRSNEELEAFAFVASHDLKEPLRQIEVFGTLLERAHGRTGDPPEKIARWFAGIQSSSRRLRALIDALAEFSRLGGQARPFRPADLGDILATALHDLEGRITDTGATIAVDPMPVIMCDASQMGQVFLNLLSNAIKYRHPARPPVMRISARVLPAARSPSPLSLRFLQLCFEDNGIGFEDRYRERIFEPFQRLHSAEELEGSGLGLAICQKVILRHGGTITASGRPNEGAVFTIAVPLRPLAEEAAPPP